MLKLVHRSRAIHITHALKFAPTLFLIALLVAPTSAHAEHSASERITDDSPYTLRPGEHRIGLTSIDYGLHGHPLLDMMDIGTNPWLWAANLGGLRSINLRLKYEFYQDDILSLSIRSAYYQIGSGKTRLRYIPIELYAGIKATRNLTVAAGYRRTQLSVKGGLELTEEYQATGNVGFTVAQVRAMAEYRLSRRTALIMRGELQQYQRLRIEAAGERDDDSAGVFVDKNLLPEEVAFNVSAVVAWSWDSFNLELGLQYGNPTIPGANAIVPQRTLLPSASMYWRF
tara:strand:+ start:55374 stop:56228 length:855 start_codon:yes stop_codon:yes gene_type:complete